MISLSLKFHSTGLLHLNTPIIPKGKENTEVNKQTKKKKKEYTI